VEMIAFAAPEVPVRIEELDRQPFLFNTLNGTLDLRTGHARAHDPKDMLTKISPVAFDPQAACPRWHAFLRKAMDGDEEMIGYLQRVIGYAATASIREQVAFILWGGGANGKSTFLEVVKAALGDYAVSTKGATIMAGARPESGGSPDPQIIALVGSRMVIAVETDEFGKLDEGRVKSLTGGDTITARFMRGEWFEFKPTFKIWLATNHRPVIRGTDNAIWDRIRLIPFTVSIPPEERIPRSRFMEKIAPELPGILAWLVQGARDWARFGLGTPQGVRKATEGYREDMDILGGFLSECCIVSKNSQAPAKDLYNAYLKWSDANGGRSISQTRFGTSLSERGFSKQRGNGGRIIWIGIGLLVNS